MLKKPCIAHDCMWYAHVTMVDPASGAPVDHWDCSMRWIPVMIADGARHTRGVQASVESMRNETIQRQDVANSHMENVSKAMPIINMIDQAVRTGLPRAQSVKVISNED